MLVVGVTGGASLIESTRIQAAINQFNNIRLIYQFLELLEIDCSVMLIIIFVLVILNILQDAEMLLGLILAMDIMLVAIMAVNIKIKTLALLRGHLLICIYQE